MSLRKQAKILGIAPSYLSMLVNGKRKWPDDLRYRYSELVNSVVNTEGKSSYEITGAQEGIRTPTPLREADFKFTAGCSPMSSTVRSGTRSLAVNRVPRQWRYSKDNCGL